MAELITKPGIYDISAEDYHADPCSEPSLSASIVKILADETPLHAWTLHPKLNPNFERKEEDKFVIGTVAHSLMLRDPKAFAILKYDDYKGGAAKAERDKARAVGVIPILEKHWDRVQLMVKIGREQLAWSSEFAGVFQNGKPEQTLIWQEGEGRDAIWFRSLLDWLPDDRSQPYDDYKTSEVAAPEKWSKNILYSVGHDISAAFYRRGIRALGLNRQPKMRFIVQEPSEPFALSGVEMTSEILELADRRIEAAIRKWRWCRQTDRWPAFPAKFHRPEVPSWMEADRMAREIRIDDMARAAKTDPDILALSFQRQSPNPKSEVKHG